jgi:hypothetical protein
VQAKKLRPDAEIALAQSQRPFGCDRSVAAGPLEGRRPPARRGARRTRLDPVHVGVVEERDDARVARELVDERRYEARDAGLAAEVVVQRRRPPRRRRAAERRDEKTGCEAHRQKLACSEA